jgi:hypothetical protein
VTRRRSAVTLVELTLALIIGSLALYIAYQGMHLMVRAEESTDRKASRTLAEARLQEMLLRDLRSSVSVAKKSADEYTISRWVMDGKKMVKRDATWRIVDKVRVTRELPGEGTMTFDFNGLLDPDEPAFRFRLEPSGDAKAGGDSTTPEPPAGGTEP